MTLRMLPPTSRVRLPYMMMTSKKNMVMARRSMTRMETRRNKKMKMRRRSDLRDVGMHFSHFWCLDAKGEKFFY
jgi:hypothetical protein